jgi:hypothetical protein
LDPARCAQTRSVVCFFAAVTEEVDRLIRAVAAVIVERKSNPASANMPALAAVLLRSRRTGGSIPVSP